MTTNSPPCENNSHRHYGIDDAGKIFKALLAFESGAAFASGPSYSMAHRLKNSKPNDRVDIKPNSPMSEVMMVYPGKEAHLRLQSR